MKPHAQAAYARAPAPANALLALWSRTDSEGGTPPRTTHTELGHSHQEQAPQHLEPFRATGSWPPITEIWFRISEICFPLTENQFPTTEN